MFFRNYNDFHGNLEDGRCMLYLGAVSQAAPRSEGFQCEHHLVSRIVCPVAAHLDGALLYRKGLQGWYASRKEACGEVESF
jgi:hypothetical protein